jgi:hypothetical protein
MCLALITKISDMYYRPWAEILNDMETEINSKRTAADKIVKAIESDISDRMGLGDVYEGLDDDMKSRIRESWRAVILKELDYLP